jgi:hypothetical protein
VSIVIDCTASPSVAALKAAGVSGVTRYLSWLPNPKVITKAELGRLIEGGISVVLNWEYSARDWLAGGAAGKLHATEAVQQAKALGYPAGHAIIGSCDFDMTAAEWGSACRAYAIAFATGIRAAGYVAGVYGPWDVLARCRALGGFAIFWQAGMSTAWSGSRNGLRWPGAHLRQLRGDTIGGVSVDVNEVLIASYGQYTGGNDVLDAANQKKLDDAYWQATNAINIDTGGRVEVSGATSLLVTHVKALEAGLLALQRSIHEGQPLTDDQLAAVMAEAREAAQAEVHTALQAAADSAGAS